MNTISKFFKAYDVRGNGAELTPELYYLVAEGLIKTILIPQNLPLKIVVGHDGRTTSDLFYKAFCKGFTDAGGEIIPIGLIPSEMMYSGAITFDCSGAIITASHNPKEDNGLKIVKRAPQMLGLSSGLADIRDFVIDKITTGFTLDIKTLSDVQKNEEAFSYVLDNWLSTCKKVGNTEYVNAIAKEKPLKVVVDTANGMGGFIMNYLVDVYKNITFIPLYWEIDGTFPNHAADPMQDHNLVDLQTAVKEHKADLGIAFDGDADRAFFVDENGEKINNELLCALFSQTMAAHVKSTRPQNAHGKPLSDAIVYVISYARCTPDTILAAGCGAIPSKQGHTFVKEKMAQYNAVYGAEASGHHYFGEFGYMDSGALTVALMLNIIADSDVPASHVLDPWKDNYFVSGEVNKTLPEGVTIDIIREKIKNQYNDAQFWTEDGITLYYPHWKASIRTSNTEPLARFNIESQQKDITQQKLSEILSLLGIQS